MPTVAASAALSCSTAAGQRSRRGASRRSPCVIRARAEGARSRSAAGRVHAAATEAPAPASTPVPRSLADVDNGKVLGFGAELSEGHPGFHDDAYKRRRVAICNAARAHEIGQPIPPVEYTEREVAVWGSCLEQLQPLWEAGACAEFLRCLPLFGFRGDVIPQLEDLSLVLHRTSGWQIRPVAGLLSPRSFLNGLAFRTFHSTQYIRHHSRPDYTPEPDVVHEMLGHVPMLADPAFTDLAHAIGVASLAADEKEIWHLTKCYWYTVEFGVVCEGGDHRAFGAGILSSFGEMRHLASGRAALQRFDPFSPQPRMSYKDGFQMRYFVLDSFEEGAAHLKDYCRSMHERLPDDVLAAVR